MDNSGAIPLIAGLSVAVTFLVALALLVFGFPDTETVLTVAEGKSFFSQSHEAVFATLEANADVYGLVLTVPLSTTVITLDGTFDCNHVDLDSEIEKLCSETYGGEYPYLNEGNITVRTTHRIGFGSGILDSESLSVTDYYSINTEFKSQDEEPKTLWQVYYVLLILDQDGVADVVDLDAYGNQTVGGLASSNYQSIWFPRAPGEYTFRTFLISGLENPQILSPVASSRAIVNEKIDLLGEGESNDRLLVQSINMTDGSVSVIETYCDASPYHNQIEITMHEGEGVSIAAVDVYFLGVEAGKAKFRFEANAGWENDDCPI